MLPVQPMKVCLRLLLLLLLLDISVGRWTQPARRISTTAGPTADRHQLVHHWPPLLAPPPGEKLPETDELLDRFDQRSPTGEHEFRYQLSNGDTRYERTYWLPVGEGRVLARRGYYSVPLPNAQFSTVFYRADHQGYHVDAYTLSGVQPLLPRHLDVAATESTPAAKRNSINVPEHNEEQQPDARATSAGGASGGTTAKGQTVPPTSEAQKQNHTESSTVAIVENISAAKVGTASTEANEEQGESDDEDVAASSSH